jgi:hypothetical protein
MTRGLPHYYRGKNRDMEVALNKIVPGSWTNDGTFRHTMEGEDDMPGHVKSSLMGASLNIPVSIVLVNGSLTVLATHVCHICELREMFAQMPSCLLEPTTRRGLRTRKQQQIEPADEKNYVCDDRRKYSKDPQWAPRVGHMAR